MATICLVISLQKIDQPFGQLGFSTGVTAAQFTWTGKLASTGSGFGFDLAFRCLSAACSLTRFFSSDRKIPLTMAIAS
jgi:hypothetical protein